MISRFIGGFLVGFLGLGVVLAWVFFAFVDAEMKADVPQLPVRLLATTGVFALIALVLLVAVLRGDRRR